MPIQRFIKTIILCISIILINDACTSKDKSVQTTELPAVAAHDTISPVKVSFDRLIGRWLRPDGGYILEIRSATADGKLDVGYFNPNSIHVAKAEWVVKEGKQYVLVELQDVNYPGSTYGLEYIESQDRLSGTYYQAVEKNTYDVEFVREQ